MRKIQTDNLMHLENKINEQNEYIPKRLKL